MFRVISRQLQPGKANTFVQATPIIVAKLQLGIRTRSFDGADFV